MSDSTTPGDATSEDTTPDDASPEDATPGETLEKTDAAADAPKPSAEKQPGEEPKAPAKKTDPEPNHEAVGIGVIDYPDDDWDPVTGQKV